MKKKKSNNENKDKEDKGIVGSFLDGIPGFGNFFRQLGKSEVFQQRFRETNEKIEENLKKGYEKKWNFEGNISTRPLSMRPSIRPLVSEIKKETPEAELEIRKDYAYGKKGNKLLLAVKVPKEDVDASLTGRYLLIKGNNFRKKIELPGFYKNIEKERYKKGILILELIK